MKSWKETRIWNILESKTGERVKEVKNFLESPQVMPKIEAVLSKGGTSPLDFTLHDEMHSFRVAERMLQIIPADTVEILSEYDLMMMLLCSYLHDIGMTPENEKVQKHFYALTHDDVGWLNEDEVNEFQKWLDSEVYGFDIRNQSLNNMPKVFELITYYCRHKHNDWSEEWIWNNLSNMQLVSYSRWQNDVVNVCKSHHYGLTFLSEEKFDPKVINDIVCHRRYIAMCLRVADVLELDPERTPSVIFKHRNVSNKSIPFWQKDQEITIRIDDGHIALYARPQRAYLQKAIEDTIEQIQHELELCNQLANKKPLRFIGSLKESNYDWKLLLLNKDVRPFENSYEFIKGQFRPNVSRVLDLLGGMELYGDKLVAVRELVQNAFDAVKERIAYKQLNLSLTGYEWEKRLGSEYRISVSLFQDDMGIWLQCSDHGVGMTKEIIENYFLVSGSSERHQTSELKRRCLAAGIQYERTGQFGIGVLSYFMIADKIVIKTKRAQGTGFDNGLEGWMFEIAGIQDFGELSKTTIEISGTEVSLLLRTSEFDKSLNIGSVIENYIKDLVIQTPCVFEFSSTIQGETRHFALEPKWANSIVDIKTYISETLGKESYNVDDSNANALGSYWSSIVDSDSPKKHSLNDRKLVSQLHVEIIDEALPNQWGRFRVIVPYFKLKSGIAFGYAEELENKEGNIELSGDVYSSPYEFGESDYSYKKFRTYSWKGLKMDLQVTRDTNSDWYLDTIVYEKFFYNIDLKNVPANLKADRRIIYINEKDKGVIDDYIDKILLDSLGRIRAKWDEGPWLLYNNIYLKNRQVKNAEEELYWFFYGYKKNHSELILKKIIFPIGVKGFDPDKRYIFRKCVLSVAHFALQFENTINIKSIMSKPLELLMLNRSNNSKSFAFILNEVTVGQRLTKVFNEYFAMKVPDVWKSIALISYRADRGPEYHFLNVAMCDPSRLESDLNKIDVLSKGAKLSDEQFYMPIIEDQHLSFAFIFKVMTLYGRSFWEKLLLDEPSFITAVWNKAFSGIDEVQYWEESLQDSFQLSIINLNGWRSIDDVEDIASYLPDLPDSGKIFEAIAEN